jgi:hypothetical protein
MHNGLIPLFFSVCCVPNTVLRNLGEKEDRQDTCHRRPTLCTNAPQQDFCREDTLKQPKIKGKKWLK